jgi:hypothetical protein
VIADDVKRDRGCYISIRLQSQEEKEKLLGILAKKGILKGHRNAWYKARLGLGKIKDLRLKENREE